MFSFPRFEPRIFPQRQKNKAKWGNFASFAAILHRYNNL
jgi:hypothetical protein